MTIPFFALISVHLTQVIGFCNLYMFFSSTEANHYASIELWPWIVLSMLSFCLLRLFLNTPRPLVHVVVVTSVFYIITVVIMSLWFIHVFSWMAWVCAWISLGITVTQGCLLNLNGCTPHTVLLCCELPVIGIFFLLWMHEGGVYFLPTYYLLSASVALLASFLSLGIMKMQSRTGDGNRPAATATSLACFAAMIGLSCGFVHFVSASASAAVSKSSQLLSWLWSTLWAGIYAFFDWLVSLMPAPEAAPLELEPDLTAIDVVETVEMTTLNPYILIALGVLGLVVVVTGLLWLLYTLRNFKLTGLYNKTTYRRPQKVTKTTSIWARFKDFCKDICERIAFSIRLFYKRNTPQGTAILLSKIGRAHGHGRRPNESYHSYLLRLDCLCHDQRLQTLSDALDCTLYGTSPLACSLTAKDYRQLRSIVRHLEKPKKAKEKTADSE